MSKSLFHILFIFSFCFTNCAFSDNIDFSLLGERSKNNFEQKQDRDYIYEGNYASLFATRDSKNLVDSWVGISSYKYRLEKKFIGTELGVRSEEKHYFFLRSDYSDINDHKFQLKIFFPHPKFEQQVQFGLFPLYVKLDNVKQTLAQKEKIVVQNKYPATVYEFKDKSCSIRIDMPHQVRVYLNGPCKDKAVLLDFYNQLSLDKLKEKLEND